MFVDEVRTFQPAVMAAVITTEISDVYINHRDESV